jgi:hypothetical protein
MRFKNSSRKLCQHSQSYNFCISQNHKLHFDDMKMDRSNLLNASKRSSDTSLLTPKHDPSIASPRRQSYLSPRRKSTQRFERRSFILQSLNSKLDLTVEEKDHDYLQKISDPKTPCELDNESTTSLSTADMTEEYLNGSVSSMDTSELEMRPLRNSIMVPLSPSEPSPSEPSERKSSVKFADWAEMSFVEDLNAFTDYDSLYYNDDELAEFRHSAFLEECGLESY